jgi:two-component system cell cycle response regulator
MAALAAGGIDLAVLCLPAQGGESLRLASRLRAQGATRDLPVLLVADPSQRGLVLRGFDLGANDHVLRPTDPNELRARVRNQIRRRRYEERLRADLDRSLELAVTDPLTGLRNRRYVHRHLEGVLRGTEAAILMLDVDRFKAINDSYGHAAGDAALREVAERLRAHVRAADVVARYGGEEFMVVLAGAQPEYALGVADRLRAALGAEPIAVGHARLAITASIGLAVAAAGTDAANAIAAADAALYRAKARGRNRVEVAEPQDFNPPGDGTPGAPNPA